MSGIVASDGASDITDITKMLDKLKHRGDSSGISARKTQPLVTVAVN